MILICVSAVAAAQVYTWRDASGKVHYSDTPPPGVEAKKIRDNTTVPNAEATSNASRSLAEQEAEFRKRQDEAKKTQAKAEQEQKESTERQRNCGAARNQLSALESGRRMSRMNAAGEAIPLDDAMRAQEIERAKQAVASWCK
ncbi:MAG: DUF4124 domain-containing protein [Zoogloeaceae bacterium]|jgi:hypothetical protein|nr:DUF4124 domain-containing protein [Zoogloeaceae bacterium]